MTSRVGSLPGIADEICRPADRGGEQRGVIASARPTREPSGQPAGPARKVASGQTSASVVPRAEKTLGSWTETDLMFASPGCCD